MRFYSSRKQASRFQSPKKRLPSRHALFLGFVVAVVASAFFGWWFLKRGKATESFFSAEFNISFSYPSDWQILSGEEVKKYSLDVQVGLIKSTAEETGVGIEISEAPGKKNFKTTESLEILDRSLSEKLGDYNKVSSREIKILANPAIEFVYIFRPFSESGRPRKPLKQMQVVFLKDEKLYFITFTALVGDYARDVKDFYQILKSFRTG